MFEPDIAKGNVSEAPEDAAYNMDDIEDYDKSEDDTTSVNETISLGAKGRKTSIKICRGKKRMRVSIVNMNLKLQTISSEFSSYMKDKTTHLSTIASAVSVTQQHEQVLMLREQDLADKKKNLFNDVINIPRLTRFEAMNGAKMLASDPSALEIFYQTPDDHKKKDFLLRLIERL